jgi:FAD/FMN-containing dehydrogenase
MRDSTGVLEQHQREEAHDLGLGWEQPEQQPGEPDRLRGQRCPQRHGLAGRRVAFVEQEVEHGGNGSEALGALDRTRGLERHRGRGHTALRPGDALLHGGLADQEGAGDPGDRKAADDAQGEGDQLAHGEVIIDREDLLPGALGPALERLSAASFSSRLRHRLERSVTCTGSSRTRTTQGNGQPWPGSSFGSRPRSWKESTMRARNRRSGASRAGPPASGRRATGSVELAPLSFLKVLEELSARTARWAGELFPPVCATGIGHQKRREPMDANRRAVLIGGLVATATAGTGGASAAPSRHVSPPALDGEIRFDQATRAAAADDFGRIVHKTPEGVLLPGSDNDVAATIRWVARQGRKFAPQGQSHSVFGRSMVRGGIVGDVSQLRTVRRVQSDRVVVDAGATWGQVLAATLPQGLTPPVLTDYLGLSVGGTLTVGGVGGTTSRFGVQSDNVIAMDVIIGKGQKVTCSAHHNADLFHAVRAGLGQVGVITRATLKLVPAPEQVRRFLLSYPDLKTMLKDERVLAGDGRFDAVQGAILAAPAGGWVFRLDTVKHFTGIPPDDSALLAGLSDDRTKRQPSTLAYVDYLNRLAALEAALRANRQWFFPHPWLTTFMGDSRVESLVGEELARLKPADLGTFGQVGLSAFRRQPVTSPLLRLPADSLCYAFNLIRIPTTDSAAEATRLVEANRATYARVRAAGGTLYPVSAFPVSRDGWRRHFGSAFTRLRDAKRKFDPGDVLTPGYGVF